MSRTLQEILQDCLGADETTLDPLADEIYEGLHRGTWAKVGYDEEVYAGLVDATKDLSDLALKVLTTVVVSNPVQPIHLLVLMAMGRRIWNKGSGSVLLANAAMAFTAFSSYPEPEEHVVAAIEKFTDDLRWVGFPDAPIRPLPEVVE